MAQACNLLYSEGDSNRWSLKDLGARMAAQPTPVEIDQSGIRIDLGEYTARPTAEKERRYQDVLAAAAPGQRAFLEKLGRRHEHVRHYLIAALGNPSLDPAFTRALPGALLTLGNAIGIFNQARQGAARRIKLIGAENSRSANAAAYELVQSARIVQHKIPIPYPPGSTLSLGTKLQASYALPGGIVTDGLGDYTFDQPRRSTGEADALIRTPGGQEYGVDFKFTGRSQVAITEDVLFAAFAVMRDGQADGWHYVTNADFSPKSRELAAWRNDELAMIEWTRSGPDRRRASDKEIEAEWGQMSAKQKWPYVSRAPQIQLHSFQQAVA